VVRGVVGGHIGLVDGDKRVGGLELAEGQRIEGMALAVGIEVVGAEEERVGHSDTVVVVEGDPVRSGLLGCRLLFSIVVESVGADLV
jgi:hypothetical protein